jgi:hypothetical protein
MVQLLAVPVLEPPEVEPPDGAAGVAGVDGVVVVVSVFFVSVEAEEELVSAPFLAPLLL